MELSQLVTLARQYAHETPPQPELLSLPEGAQIASWIDHTLLKPEATAEQI
jgi:hypothetical protein